MKIIVKRFWAYCLAAMIVIGSISLANFSAMAEVIDQTTQTGYVIDVVYNEEHTAAVLQGNVQEVKEGVELLSLQDQAGEMLNPNDFRKSVSENGTYTFTLTYHGIHEDKNQHEHIGHEDYTEEITVTVDQIVQQESAVALENGIQLSDYTLANFENARAAGDAITDIPEQQITFKGYQMATYKDKAQNPAFEELITINLTQENQTKFDTYMRNTGLKSGYISEDSMSGLSLTGLTFDSLVTITGRETHNIAYIIKKEGAIYYLTDEMINNSAQSTVLAKASVGQEFQIRYRAVDQREVKLNLNQSRAQSLGITFELNGREPKWSNGTLMNEVYVTSGTTISIKATYPNKYNQANITITPHATPININENTVFNANKLTKLFAFKIGTADQIGAQILNVNWDFADTRPTNAHLIGLVDTAKHPADNSANNAGFFSGVTRFSRPKGTNSIPETFYKAHFNGANTSGIFSPYRTGPYAGKTIGVLAQEGLTFPPYGGPHGILKGQNASDELIDTNNVGYFKKENFSPYSIALWNSEKGGSTKTFNNFSANNNVANFKTSTTYPNDTGVFKTNIDGTMYDMFLGSFSGNNSEQVYEYDFEWGAPSNRYTTAPQRVGEYPSVVLRYDTYAPDTHMVYVNGNNEPQSTAQPVYTEYLTMPALPTSISDLLRKNGMNVNNYSFTQIPVNTEVVHHTSDGATVKIKLKSVGVSRLTQYGSAIDKMDQSTTIKSYKYQITVINANRDIRMSIASDSNANNYLNNIFISNNTNINNISIVDKNRRVYNSNTTLQITDVNRGAFCTHNGSTTSVPGVDTQGSVDGAGGNYLYVSVRVPKGFGGVTYTIEQNGTQLDSKYLQLCYISTETVNGVEMSIYHYHYFGNKAGGLYSRKITFDVTPLHNVSIKYKKTENDSGGFIDSAEVRNKNFLHGTSQDDSKVLISEVIPPTIPSGREFIGWKLSLRDVTRNQYITKANNEIAYVFKDGINGSAPFIGGDLLDCAWLYEQLNLNDYLKKNHSSTFSQINFEVRVQPIFVQASNLGTTIKRGEIQFFYQGSLGTANKNINQATYSRFKGEKESKTFPSNSIVISMSTEEKLPALRRFVGDFTNANRYEASKFKYNPLLSVTSNSDIASGEVADTNGMDVIAHLFYDRLFDVQYARAEITNLGVSMNGIEDNLGEYTLTSGNGSVVTLHPSLVNNSLVGEWKIKELKEANIDHTLTVTNGTIDLSTLSSAAKEKLLEMDSANKRASYSTVTLVAEPPPPPLEIVDQSRDDLLWIHGDSINGDAFIWVDLLSQYGTTGEIAANVERTLVRVRNGQETEYIFGTGNVIDAATEIIDTTQARKRVRIKLQFKSGFTDIQDGDQFYIKLSLKSDSTIFVKSEDPVTARLVNLWDRLTAGIDGMVSMPSSVILSEQNDGSLASSVQDITLNPFGHTKNGDHWDDSNADYNWKTRETYIDVSISNPLVALISSRSNARRFEAQVQDVAGQNVIANSTFGSFRYGTSVDTDRLLQYKVVAPKPVGASSGETYTGTLTFQFRTNSNAH